MADADDKALYAGFRASDAALSVLFTALLRPAVRSRIKSRWKSLRHVHADMASHCEDTLIEWRAAGSLREEESVGELVRASAVVFQRADERHGRIGEAAAAARPSAPTIRRGQRTRKMSERARAALYAAINEAKPTAADFFDGYTGGDDA